jgi:hypothetical protein
MAITKASSNAVAAAAKGDLVAGSATNDAAVLAVGANDTVLTADSSTATGLKWAAAAGGGANWSLLNSGGTSLSGAATVTVSGISGKDKIMILIQDASSANSGQTISIRFNEDSTGKYGYSVLFNTIASTYAYSNYIYEAQLTTDRFGVGTMGNSANNYVSSFLLASGCNSSGVKVVSFSGAGDGTNARQITGGGFYSGTSTISSISVVSGAGNLDAGTVYVYTSA